MCIWAADHQMVLPVKLQRTVDNTGCITEACWAPQTLREGQKQNAQCRISAATVVLQRKPESKTAKVCKERSIFILPYY